MCIENCLNIRHVQDVPKKGGTTFKSEKVGRGLQLRKRTPSPLDRFPYGLHPKGGVPIIKMEI